MRGLGLVLLVTLAAGMDGARAQEPNLRPVNTGVSVNPPSTSAGGLLTIAGWIIENSGTVDAPRFSSGLYLSSDNSITPADRRIAGRFIAVAAGGQSFWNATAALPPDLLPGRYYIGILVDEGGIVAESVEDDNAAASSTALLEIRAPVNADLVPSAGGIVLAGGHPVQAFVTPTTVARGGRLYLIGWGVTNAGTEEAGGFDVTYYLSTDDLITSGDIPLGGSAVAGLRAGATHQSTAVTRLQIPADVTYRTYYFGILIDQRRQVAELFGGGATNNSITRPVRIAVGPPDTTLVWRVQVGLQTDNGSTSKTDDAVWVKLNSTNRTYLDYEFDDFEVGANAKYDLRLEDVSRLHDITQIEVGKAGTNGWCVRGVELYVNNLKVFRRNFSPSCQWIDPPDGRHRIVIPYSELRLNSLWDDYTATGSLLATATLPGTATAGFAATDLSSLLQSQLGHITAQTPLYWGRFDDPPVELSRRSISSVAVSIDLGVERPGPPDDVTGTIKFRLDLHCSCAGFTVTPRFEEVLLDSPLWEAILTAGLTELLEGYISEKVSQELIIRAKGFVQPFRQDVGFCPKIEVQANGDVLLNAPTGPDLTVQLTVSPPQAMPGSMLTSSQVLSNVGGGDAGQFGDTVYLALGTQLQSRDLATLARTGVRLSGRVGPAVPACTGSVNWSDQIQLPTTLQCTAFATPPYAPPLPIEAARAHRDYFVIAHVTSPGDNNPNNDIVAQSVRVGLPDLQVSFLNSPGRVRFRGEITVDAVTIGNRGIFTSGPLRFRIFVAPQAAIPDTTWLAQSDTTALASGAFLSWQRRIFTLPPTLRPGIYFLGARVEQRDGRPECDLANNVQVVPFEIIY